MPKKSAGILFYRFTDGLPEVLLVHPGGPFWVNKHLGAWSVPKGEFEPGEEPLAAAIREVKEELGLADVSGDFVELASATQKSGKIIYTWALQRDVDVSNITSNTFELEWPPKSGKMILIPEVDKAGWFNLQEARERIIPGQIPVLDSFVYKLK